MDYQNYSTTETPDLFPEEQMVYGTFWERLGAAIMDGLIVGIINFLILFVMQDYIANIISFFLGWLYYAIQESGPSQATIGKRAVGLKVVTTEGHPISFSRATGRYFGKWVSAIILFIGYLMMLWSERKQTLHDMMAGTLVIKK